MAITFPNAVKAVGSGVASVTTSGVTTTSGSTFVIGCTFGQGFWGSIGSFTDSKGNTYTRTGTQAVEGVLFELAYCENGVGGAGHTATVTGSSGNDYPTAFFLEIAGAAAASYDAGATVKVADTSAPFSVTSNALAQADSAIVAISTSWEGGVVNQDITSGYTVLKEDDYGSYFGGAFGYKTVASAAAQTATTTGVTASTALGIFAFKAAGGGANTNVNPAQAEVSLTGPAPTIVRTAHQSVRPAPASVSLSGLAPAIVQNNNVQPAPAVCTLTGFAPAITQATVLSPAADTLTLTGLAPLLLQTAHQTAAPGAEALVLTGYAPTIINSSTPPAPTGLPGLDYEAAPSTRRAKFVSIKPPLQAALERRLPEPEDGEPTYSQMRVDDATGELIRAWAAGQGFQTVVDDLHVTLAYSREPVDLSGVQLLDGFAVPRTGRGLDQFGDAVVLTFTSARLTQQWQAIRDAGASWDFPDYQPHITITYEKGGAELADVRPYTGPIVLLDEERSALESGFDAEESPVVTAVAAGLVELQNEQLTPELVARLARQWRPAGEIAQNSTAEDLQLQYLRGVEAEKEAREAQAARDAQLVAARQRAKAKADDEEAIARAVALLF